MACRRSPRLMALRLTKAAHQAGEELADGLDHYRRGWDLWASAVQAEQPEAQMPESLRPLVVAWEEALALCSDPRKERARLSKAIFGW